MIFLLLLTFLQSGFSFTLNTSTGAHFDEDEVYVDVADSNCTNANLTPAFIMDMAIRGVDRFWNTVPTSKLRIRRGNFKTVNANFNTGLLCDSSTSCTGTQVPKVGTNILIVCNSNVTNFSGTTVLGVTLPSSVEGRTIYGAVILLNDVSGSMIQTLTHEELSSLLAHEIGHALGLGHSKHDGNLMYYQTNPNRERLGRDDIDGITFLYPKKENPFKKLKSCGTVSLTDGNDDDFDGFLTFILPLLMGLFALPFYKVLLRFKRLNL